MIVRAIEIRDRGTFIAAFAMGTAPANQAQEYLLGRAGWAPDGVIVGRLDSGLAHTDPYDWGDRTMKTAHIWLSQNFDSVKDGDVIDVQFILGETAAPKISEGA